jgi:hypothetical protein
MPWLGCVGCSRKEGSEIGDYGTYQRRGSGLAVEFIHLRPIVISVIIETQGDE